MRADSSAIRFSSSFRSSGWLHDCSVIENPDAGGVAWDGKVIVSNAMTHLTPGFRCPLPGPWTGRWPRFGLCGHNTRAGSGVRALRAKKELNRRTRGLRRIKCPRPCQPPTRKIANFDMVFPSKLHNSSPLTAHRTWVVDPLIPSGLTRFIRALRNGRNSPVEEAFEQARRVRGTW